MRTACGRPALRAILIAVVAGTATAGASPPDDADAPTVHDLRSRVLATDQVLLEYRFDADGGSVRLVSQDRERAAAIPAGGDSVRALVEALRAGIRAGDAVPAAAAALHELLVAPVAADLPPEARLVVIGDGVLRELPWGALRDRDAFLAERHAISTAPSAAAIAGPKGKRVPRPRPAAGLAPAAVDSFLAANGAALRRVDLLPVAAEESMLADVARGLADRLPPDVALRRAQRAAVARGAPPAEWAPFVVSGRMSAPRADGKFPAWLVPVGLAIGLALLAATMRRARAGDAARKENPSRTGR